MIRYKDLPPNRKEGRFLFFPPGTDERAEMPAYSGVCTVVWEDNDKTVILEGMKIDNMTRQHMNDVVMFCLTHRVERIRAKRSENKTLPVGHPVIIKGEEWIEIDVLKAANRRKIAREELNG